MWNQWSAGPPPMPPSTSINPQPPLTGPVQPAGAPILSGPAPPTQTDPAPPTLTLSSGVQPVSYQSGAPSYTPAPPTPTATPVAQPVSYHTGAPSYTPAQYAAMTPEQQYAVQQHWQQWQAYEQQYAQWHAQYGEQYKREMAAIQSTPQPTVVPYDTTAVSNAYNYPPPAISNPYQVPPVPTSAPPPPPPDDNTSLKGIKAPAQLYEQPPPPPPPPQQETSSTQNRNDALVPSQSTTNLQGQNSTLSQSLQNQENRWNQPPPFSGPNSGNRWNEPNQVPFNHQDKDRQQYNQQNRQQQNQQNRQQNQFNQQDRQQQNQFNQQFNNNSPHGRQNQNNNSRNQQEDEQGRNNWQGNRQNNNNFRGRNRGRNGNNYETEHQFDDSDGRNNYQKPCWQSDNLGERNNRGGFSNRFDNGYDNFNKNLGQNINQLGSNNWNNNVQTGNFGTAEPLRQKQSSENQITSNEKTQKLATGGSVDEKAFDEQFRMWEEQFENWKKENANHPDRTMYMQYEREFEKTRVRLLERREQMRRRKVMEMQQKSNPQVESEKLVAQQQQPPEPNPQQEQNQLEPKLPQKQTVHLETAQHIQHENYGNDSDKTEKFIETTQKADKTPENCENSDMEQSEPEDTGLVSSTNLDDPSKGVGNETESINTSETSIFQKQEMTDLFKTGGGIPGLDLVGSKDGDVADNPNEKDKVSNVIDLDNDGPTRPPKISATSTNSGMISTTPQPQLLTDIDSRPHSLFLASQSQNSQPLRRKIPSLFDIVVEKPVLSPDNEKKSISPLHRNSPVRTKTSKADTPPDPDSHSRSISRDRDTLASPAQRPLSQMSVEQCPQQTLPNQQQSNLPPHTADLAKALQDPNVMQLLSVALAQAQKSGCINPTGNIQQNQLLQQLQQLQPLIQMQQERNFNNQSWDNSQLERPQPWRNQNQNFDSRFNTTMNQQENSNNRFNPNLSQNRNRFDSNPFNKNYNEMNMSRRSGNANLCDTNRDMPQKNPRNPFRRGTGIQDQSSGGINFEKDVEGIESERDSFWNSSNNAFGAPINPQNQRGGNFGNNNFGRDFGGGQRNFGGQKFGGNFDEENFSRGGDNFGGDDSRDNNYDRHNFDEENSSGGGSLNNRPDSSFKNSLGFRNNTNNFGDRSVCDNDYFRPTQIFDYQNRSRPEALMPPAKIVDYGHKPSALLPTTSFSRDNNEFVPVKTIDYGHSSTSTKPRNPFQEKNEKKTNRWNQEQETNQEQHQQQRSTSSRGNDNETKTSGLTQNNQEQNENSNENNFEQLSRLAKTENVKEAGSENLQEYPKNKWILQNPENRQRPGPPTKRGKRNSTQFNPEPIKDETQAEVFECDEIEENFEEISDNECIIEDTDIPPRNTQIKKKSVSLFPSVSDSNKNPSMIIPSNENNNTIPIDEILFKPGRLTRPKNIVIIMRGPPGSGKSHVAKLIKDKEVEMGGQTPRLLSVDDYFMVENDYEEKCPKTGRKIPKKEILYEYEKEMESTYMQYLIKSFKKTVTDHLFDFIIVDCGNQSLRTFNEFYNAARDGNFSPFVIDLKCDLETCLEQNIHNRKEEDIKEIIENYQDCPGHYIKLDVSNLLENVVEMEDVSDLEDHFAADSEVIELDDEEVEEEGSDNNDDGFLKSKWDTDPTTENLARLDGTSKPISKRGTATLEEYLQIDGWEPPASNTNGKKRVRWADIEEKRAQDKMRAIGFVVGQTDWNRMMDPTSGSGALTKTKYIERLNKRR